MRRLILLSGMCAGFTCLAVQAAAHDGPDPVMHWHFGSRDLDGATLRARRGPDARFTSDVRLQPDELGESAVFGPRLRCIVAEDYRTQAERLPSDAMTVAAWIAVDEPQRWGGIVGVIEDNGDTERGWVLGYDEHVFTFTLSTTGADDGDGRLTVVRGTTPWEAGRMYHVVAVFDGRTTELYVNGKREAATGDQWGSVLYPESAEFVIGGYHDRNEDYRLTGRIRDIRIYDLAARPAWVEQEFEHHRRLAELEAQPVRDKDGFAVTPYLQFGTQTGMTVMWRTVRPGTSAVHYGESVECGRTVRRDESAEIHEVRIDGLQPETQYFYCVETVLDDGRVVESPPLTFSTAVRPETPFAFAVFGDTQKNPQVSLQLAELAWAHRPGFLIHAGDLVDRGTVAEHWTEHFFPGVRPLAERVPFYPVLGNHEENAQNYFDYMALPAPEYYYDFVYGNAHFFMLDSNRDVHPDSEQYAWLKGRLAESAAEWKIVCHHHPPWSSDENDYGDLWKVNVSTRGDLRARQLTPLYDEYGVDLVWNGHIHSYERTWPLRSGRAVEQNGTIYMITGGAGGSLESAGPFRPFFTNTVRRGHHYCMVMVNGGTLELKAYDLEGRLFDMVTLRKHRREASANADRGEE